MTLTKSDARNTILKILNYYVRRTFVNRSCDRILRMRRLPRKLQSHAGDYSRELCWRECISLAIYLIKGTFFPCCTRVRYETVFTERGYALNQLMLTLAVSSVAVSSLRSPGGKVYYMNMR